MAARMCSSSTSGSHGLAMKVSAPAARTVAGLGHSTCALSARTGTCAVAKSLLRRLIASSPSRTGIHRSIKMRSGVFLWAFSTASQPLRASSTVNPQKVSQRRHNSRISAESSAMSMRCGRRVVRRSILLTLQERRHALTLQERRREQTGCGTFAPQDSERQSSTGGKPPGSLVNVGVTTVHNLPPVILPIPLSLTQRRDTRSQVRTIEHQSTHARR